MSQFFGRSSGSDHCAPLFSQSPLYRRTATTVASS